MYQHVKLISYRLDIKTLNFYNTGVKKLEASDPDIAHIVKSETVTDSGPAPALPKRKGSLDVKATPVKPSYNKSTSSDLGHAPRLPDRQSAPRNAKPETAKTSNPPPKSVVSKQVADDDSDGEIYGGDYEMIDEDKPLEPPNKANKSTTGYANDILCQVKPFSDRKTEDVSDEGDDYEEVTEDIVDPKLKAHSKVDKERPKKEAPTPQIQADELYYSAADINLEKTPEVTGNEDNTAQAEENAKPCYVSGKSIKELGEILVKLRLGKYAERFAEDLIDGEIVQDLTADDLKADYQFTKTEAIRLRKYIEQGHIPQ
jgi:hypothetical protein